MMMTMMGRIISSGINLDLLESAVVGCSSQCAGIVVVAQLLLLLAWLNNGKQIVVGHNRCIGPQPCSKPFWHKIICPLFAKIVAGPEEKPTWQDI
jgi:hypothetical protein